MASINDLNTRLTQANGITIYKNQATLAVSGFFAIQFLSDGTYDFTIDGTAYTSIKVKGGVVLYGDITSIASNGASTDAVALYKN